jgi:hypothetical protein
MPRRRFKVLSKVAYRAGTSVKPHALPKFNHTNGIEGVRLEFQDVRLFFPVEQP